MEDLDMRKFFKLILVRELCIHRCVHLSPNAAYYRIVLFYRTQLNLFSTILQIPGDSFRFENERAHEHMSYSL